MSSTQRLVVAAVIGTSLSQATPSVAQPVSQILRGTSGTKGRTPWIGSNVPAGRGQDGSDITLSTSSSSSSGATQRSTLIDLETYGGAGGDGNATGPYSVPGAAGGSGGKVNLTLSGFMSASGDQATGIPLILLESGGGKGGDGLHGVGRGGDGSAVNLHLNGEAKTGGINFAGILLRSAGGAAGYGGTERENIQSQAGGLGGDVSFTLSADSIVATSGSAAPAVVMSSLGGAGSQRGSGTFYSDPYVTLGGGGGNVIFSSAGSISTSGNDAIAVLLQSVGGKGGSQGNAGGRDGTRGGDGGEVRASQTGTIRTAGDNGIGILAQSVGGTGGKGGDAVFTGGNGGSAGAGRFVSINNSGNVSTAGKSAPAILAQSIGGGNAADAFRIGNPVSERAGTGGAGGKGGLFLFGGGGTGGTGGAGGNIQLSNSGRVETTGDGSIGALAQSIGGGGGNGGAATAYGSFVGIALGGDGGSGGAGGAATATNSGTISTAGDRSSAIVAQSVGGSGGLGGSATAKTLGAVFAFSYSLGGRGGDGGNGGTATVTNDSALSTAGMSASGISALSIGGGGGIGSDASSYAFAASPPNLPIPSVAVTYALGGSGGNGGNGGQTTVVNGGSIETTGMQSFGIEAASIGGGGGDAASAVAQSNMLGRVLNIGVAIAEGGSGGGGGSGGFVDARNSRNITTSGAYSAGMLALSVGGGGGVAGTADSSASVGFPSQIPDSTYLSNATSLYTADAVSVNVALGGRGGGGGAGGRVALLNSGRITTNGSNAPGIFAQSIGGGGGDAGGSQSSGAKGVAVRVDIGGSGGNGGGAGGDVIVNNGSTGIIRTAAPGSNGIVAQSVGGGGGFGGTMTAQTVTTPSSSNAFGYIKKLSGVLGGLNSAATYANKKLDLRFPKFTSGSNFQLNLKIFTSSVKQLDNLLTPNDGVASTLAKTGYTALLATVQATYKDQLFKISKGNVSVPQTDLALSLGGTGGNGGNGGSVTVNNDGSVVTAGDNSVGILAQSIGGGGGAGGVASAEGKRTVNLTVGLGASGGLGGSGGSVILNNKGSVSTTGTNAFGLFGQSVGGGGGIGGASTAASGASASVNVALGGSSGGSSSGGAVSVANDGTIATSGQGAHGIFAQSVGGGGGVAVIGLAANPAAAKPDADQSALDDALAASQQLLTKLGIAGGTASTGTASITKLATINYQLGGSGQKSGAGGPVSIVDSGSITTTGAKAFGVFGQSIGGGGGAGTDAGDQSGIAPYTSLIFGGRGGGGGNGGSVTLQYRGSNAALTTSGTGATGIFLESIGGGGGYNGVGSLVLSDTAENGDGGPLSLTGTDGQARLKIATTGNDADGIFMQSLGGGGGAVSASDTGQTGTTGTTRSTVKGSGGAITVNAAGVVNVAGAGSTGIALQSGIQNSAGRIVGNGGNIDLTFKGSITGGSGTGSAIQIDGGKQNTVTLSDGTVSAASGMAISASGGRTYITNNGTLIGNVTAIKLWGNGNEVLSNGSGGIYRPGEFVNLGGGFLVNQGSVVLDQSKSYGGTTLTGNYTQTGSGQLVDNADFRNRSISTLRVTGKANLAGTLRVILNNPAPGLPLTVLQAEQGLTGNVVAPSDLIVYSYEPRTTANALLVGLNAKFNQAAATFDFNRLSVANTLQDQWDRGVTDTKYDAFTSISTLGGYGRALDQLMPSESSAEGSHVSDTAQKFMTNMMSCPYFPGQETVTREGDCSWARVTGGRTRQVETADNVGYGISDVSYQIGGQKHVSPEWILGGSVAYDTSWYNADGAGSQGMGQDGSIGLAIKYQPGRWLLAGALDGGLSWYRNSRQVTLDDLDTTAHSNSLLEHLSARFRPSYQLPFGRFYTRLYGDIDATWAHAPGYAEHDAGTYDLAVQGSSQVTVTASPMIELGGRVERTGFDLKPYAAIGLTARSNNGWLVQTRFADDPSDGDAFGNITYLPWMTADGTVGLDLLMHGGFEIKGYYSVKATATFLAQEGSLRIGCTF